MSDGLQPYQRNRSIASRQRQRYSWCDGAPVYRPPVCSHCGARNIRPFSSIYGRGTTYYTRIKGFVLKHGYERTKRQSVLAHKFSPPLRLPWAPAVFLALMCFAARWGAGRWEAVSSFMALAYFYLGWGAVLFAALTSVNNFGFYPIRIATWNSSYYCEKCGRVTVLATGS